MPQTVVPIHIRPHLIPFLFNEMKGIETTYEGREIIAARVTKHSYIGRITRLLLKKSDTKPECDTNHQTFLLVGEQALPPLFMKPEYTFEDGRSSFLYMPEAGEQILNDQLQHIFETALMFHINSWRDSSTEKGIDVAIVKFLEEYHLEEFNFTILGIRRDYYRKLKSGFFKGRVIYNPIKKELEQK